MPGRSCGQFGPLQQHHIRPAFEGQVVERADADDTAANDDHAGMIFHRGSPNTNASGSVTTGRPNKTPIATAAYGNAPGQTETGPFRARFGLQLRPENDKYMSETD